MALRYQQPGEIVDLLAAVIAERRRRLAAGFDYDFGPPRGVHRIGTTEADLIGWDEVSKLAAAGRAVGQPGAAIDIATDTGPCQVTAGEWADVELAAGAARQPIWAASFAVAAKVEAGQITTLAGVRDAPDWPG